MPTPATSHPDRAALSGLLAGVGFVGGVAGAMALADLPFPRPEPTPPRSASTSPRTPAARPG
jgi:hypothetical protein